MMLVMVKGGRHLHEKIQNTMEPPEIWLKLDSFPAPKKVSQIPLYYYRFEGEHDDSEVLQKVAH